MSEISKEELNIAADCLEENGFSEIADRLRSTGLSMFLEVGEILEIGIQGNHIQKFAVRSIEPSHWIGSGRAQFGCTVELISRVHPRFGTTTTHTSTSTTTTGYPRVQNSTTTGIPGWGEDQR